MVGLYLNPPDKALVLWVELVDERLTSVAAETRLREAGLGGRARKAVLDSVAAQEILQSYLDSNHVPT